MRVHGYPSFAGPYDAIIVADGVYSPSWASDSDLTESRQVDLHEARAWIVGPNFSLRYVPGASAAPNRQRVVGTLSETPHGR